MVRRELSYSWKSLLQSPIATSPGVRDLLERAASEAPGGRAVEGALVVLAQALSTLLAQPGTAVLAVDEGGWIVLACGAVERLLGARSDELVHRSDLAALHGEAVASSLTAAMAAARADGGGPLTPRRLAARSGSNLGAELAVEGDVFSAGFGEVAALLTYSDPRRGEDVLLTLDTEAMFRRLFEAVRQGVFFSTSAGQFIEVNRALQEMLGYPSREELLAIDIAQDLYACPERRVELRQLVEEQGFVKDFEVQFKRHDGREITVLLTAHRLTNSVGKLVGYQGLVHDVTTQRQLQAQVVQAEKLATLGTLAAGVAHELNNPLGGILVYAHLLLEQTPADDPRARQLERVVREATRCRDIVRELLRFGRRSEPSVRPIEVNAVLGVVTGLLESQALFQNVRVVRSLGEDLPLALVDPAQLEQVFANILLNAAEAMAGRGTITLSTDLKEEGQTVQVIIGDDGPGMAEDVRQRIFEPFFTTKGPAGACLGTGLGLAISRGIILAVGGSIDVETSPGQGTAFLIGLPAVTGGR